MSDNRQQLLHHRNSTRPTEDVDCPAPHLLSSSYPCSIRVPRQFVHYSAHAGHVQKGAQHRDASQEINCRREETGEEQKEPVRLDDHADQRESDQHHDDAAEEGDRPFQLMLLEEEAERPVQTDNAGQAAEEKDLEGESG